MFVTHIVREIEEQQIRKVFRTKRMPSALIAGLR